MSILWLPIGLLLPTISGWLLCSCIEGKSPVLGHIERMVVGGLVGIVLTMFVTFFVHYTGLVPLTWWGYLLVQILWTGGLWCVWRKRAPLYASEAKTDSGNAPQWIRIILIILAVWTGIKIVTSAVAMLGTPVYLDDVFNNWNMRGKIFHVEQQIVLDIEVGTGSGNVSRTGVSSYPPTIPMIKAWLSSLAGQWSDPLVNSVHIVWYLSVLYLMYAGLRRFVAWHWACLGSYALASLPFFHIHGTNPYVDVFLSGLALFSVYGLMMGTSLEDKPYQETWFGLAGISTACLAFLKNEGLVLYQPILLLVALLGIVHIWKIRAVSVQFCITLLARYTTPVLIIALPWWIFKTMNGMTFGNAKDIGGIALECHQSVIPDLLRGTFMMGTWSVLPGIFFMLVLLNVRQWIRSPMLLAIAFVCITYIGQSAIFVCTELYTELSNQTGFSRGLVHFMPVAVFVSVVLFSRWIQVSKE